MSIFKTELNRQCTFRVTSRLQNIFNKWRKTLLIGYVTLLEICGKFCSSLMDYCQMQEPKCKKANWGLLANTQ